MINTINEYKKNKKTNFKKTNKSYQVFKNKRKK